MKTRQWREGASVAGVHQSATADSRQWRTRPGSVGAEVSSLGQSRAAHEIVHCDSEISSINTPPNFAIDSSSNQSTQHIGQSILRQDSDDHAAACPRERIWVTVQYIIGGPPSVHCPPPDVPSSAFNKSLPLLCNRPTLQLFSGVKPFSAWRRFPAFRHRRHQSDPHAHLQQNLIRRDLPRLISRSLSPLGR